ncbi:MAG: hypothetical protein H0W87_03965 [Actinobacteria bacterium]|nr:hypothetical protein [Actinomycetota bacterium]
MHDTAVEVEPVRTAIKRAQFAQAQSCAERECVQRGGEAATKPRVVGLAMHDDRRGLFRRQDPRRLLALGSNRDRHPGARVRIDLAVPLCKPERNSERCESLTRVLGGRLRGKGVDEPLHVATGQGQRSCSSYLRTTEGL